jgi:DNA primase
MPDYISKEKLRSLRNDIPVDRVIEHFLNLPCKVSEGYFRFLCPVCSEFTTAVNPKTNLARCFGCEKNFNPIDMVITVEKCRFKDAVAGLEKFRGSKL